MTMSNRQFQCRVMKRNGTWTDWMPLFDVNECPVLVSAGVTRTMRDLFSGVKDWEATNGQVWFRKGKYKPLSTPGAVPPVKKKATIRVANILHRSIDGSMFEKPLTV